MGASQHAVPQNIMDVEFKLIGDLTMRQFMYLLVFGGLSYGCAEGLTGLFKWPATFFFALLGLGLAFVPVQDRGLDQWFVNFFKSVYAPTQRVWRKAATIPSVFLKQSLNVVKHELITLAPTSSRRKLEEYLEYQETKAPADPLDIPEKEYILKVREAFAPYMKPTPPAQAGAIAVEPELPKEQPIPQKEEKPTEKVEERKITEAVKAAIPAIKLEVKQAEVERKKEDLPAQAGKPKLLVLPKRKQADTLTVPPMTPDRHSGRPFMNLLPSQGELILPIRGERVLRTSDQIMKTEKIDADMDEKTQKLKQLLNQIKGREGAKIPDLENLQIEREGEQKQKVVRKGIFAVSDKIPLKAKDTRVTREYSVPLHTAAQVLGGRPNLITGFVKYDDGKPVEEVVVLVKNSKGEPVRAIKTNSLGQFSLVTPLLNDRYTVEVSPSSATGANFDIISLSLKGEVLPPLEMIGKR